ncbi:molybdenum-dependent transcriptional regulator [Nitrosophilus kaiyonis]|uniref:molybdenum-dependent transcriptional regulator n=1 Tax=Nitrosophilus kaiyonis TaxID=2930200 RepID=UPI002490D624|nr:molybdenum-dependent transcriptional regulator [Nitrosophilus kaiyonis]
MKQKIEGRFWIKKDNKNFLGHGRVELLKKIDKYGSISKAAREMKMSYKAAWDAVDIMNNLSEEPILEKVAGGKGGGGSRLTEYGKKLIKEWEMLEESYKNFLNSLESFDKKVFGYKISARNRLLCEIENIKCEDELCELTLKLKGGIYIKSKITESAVEELNLKKEDKVIAIIKSTSINVYSFKNEGFLKSYVKSIKIGKNYKNVTFETENGYILNCITDINIDKNREYYLYVRPEDVLIGI